MSANAKKQLLTGESSRPGKEAIINEGIGRAPAQILVDGGDPEETVRVKRLVGYVDGQTTNPTLVARNPEVRTLVSSGQKFSSREELAEYRKIVQAISPVVGGAGVSIEVFADFDTTAEELLAQGREMFSWIPNAYIKYPCTHEGLRAAQSGRRRSPRPNMSARDPIPVLCYTIQDIVLHGGRDQ